MNASAAAGPAATKPERLSSAVSDVGRFAIVPTWLLTSGVSDRAVRLYACLAGQYANYDTKEAFPLRRTLATDLGCSLSSADRAIDELTQIGALLVEQRQASTGDYISNIYRIRIATPDGLVRDAVLESPAPAEGGVYSPVTRGVYSPVTRGLFTGDDTESSTTRSTKQDQVRTPPPPPPPRGRGHQRRNHRSTNRRCDHRRAGNEPRRRPRSPSSGPTKSSATVPAAHLHGPPRCGSSGRNSRAPVRPGWTFRRRGAVGIRPSATMTARVSCASWSSSGRTTSRCCVTPSGRSVTA